MITHLPPGGDEIAPHLFYGGCGPGGEYYRREFPGTSIDSISIWVQEDDIQWEPEDFESIAADMRKRRLIRSIENLKQQPNLAPETRVLLDLTIQAQQTGQMPTLPTTTA